MIKGDIKVHTETYATKTVEYKGWMEGQKFPHELWKDLHTAVDVAKSMGFVIGTEVQSIHSRKFGKVTEFADSLQKGIDALDEPTVIGVTWYESKNLLYYAPHEIMLVEQYPI